MITIIPSSHLELFKEGKKIVDLNTLPQINTNLLSFIKDKMEIDSTPIACASTKLKNINDITDCLIPVNSNDLLVDVQFNSVDSLSISFDNILKFSDILDNCHESEIEYIKEEFYISLNDEMSLDSIITFIPYISKNISNSYVKLDSNFKQIKYKINGLKEIKLNKINIF